MKVKRRLPVLGLVLLLLVPCLLGQIPETAIKDGSILARVADAETITAIWTHTANLRLSGTNIALYGSSDRNIILSGGSGASSGANIILYGESHATLPNETRFRVGASNAMAIGASGRVAIGAASANTKALLDLTSTTLGFLPPRMTTAQRDAIASPPAGLTVYNTTTGAPNYYNGTSWLSSSGLLDSSGRLAINEASPSAQFEVESADAGRTTAIFRAALNPTIDQFVIEDNAGTNILTIDSTGRMILGLASTDVTGTSLVANESIALATTTSNASVGSLAAIAGSYVAIGSGSSGSGTVLPIAFFIGGTEYYRMLADKPVIVFDEADGDPTTANLDANDSVAVYTKNNKFVIAYNNAGVMTYLVATLNGSTTTWTNSTTAP